MNQSRKIVLPARPNAETPEFQKSGLMYNIRLHLLILRIKDRYIIAICSIFNIMAMSIIHTTIQLGETVVYVESFSPAHIS